MENSYKDWKFYNHAIIPDVAPHITPSLEILRDKRRFNPKKWNGNKPLMIRYTTLFDEIEKSNWWYLICDKPFDINSLNTKKRYQIKQARKYYEVKVINPLDYVDELYFINIEAQKSYPAKNRSLSTRDEYFTYLKGLGSNEKIVVYGAFFRETNKLVGYCVTPEYEEYIELQSQKAIPEFEKYELNAALIDAVFERNNEKLSDDSSHFYICDGARNINHETKFQDYLERKFGFRKAFCQLNIQYSKKIYWFVVLAYPFRKLLRKMDGIKVCHLLNAVLKMEEIRREKNE